eukprot:3452603-Prymnesium_polylepis.1
MFDSRQRTRPPPPLGATRLRSSHLRHAIGAEEDTTTTARQVWSGIRRAAAADQESAVGYMRRPGLGHQGRGGASKSARRRIKTRSAGNQNAAGAASKESGWGIQTRPARGSSRDGA